MNDNDKVALAKTLKKESQEFSPVLQQEIWSHIARLYKIKYDCFRKEGFTVLESLRLVAGCYE